MANPPQKIGTEISEAATASFLAAHHTGVLSLGVENRGYGFPISYTCDQENRRLILGLVTLEGSKKRTFMDDTAEATFSVYTYEEADSWQSVTVTGPIRHVDADDSTHRVPTLFFLPESNDFTDDGQMVDLDEFERTWYELEIKTLTGRNSN